MSSIRSSFQIRHASSGAPISSWSASTKARSPTRIATPSPKRRDSPAQPAARVLAGVDGVRGRRAPAAGGVVHHVVVEQGEGVHQLERRAGVDDPLVVGVAAGADEAPVAERRAQALAARQHQPVGSRRTARRGRDRTPPTDPRARQSSSVAEPARSTHGQRSRRDSPEATGGHVGRGSCPIRAAGRSAGVGIAVEVGDHLVDAQAGGADAVAAHRDQLGGPGDTVGEAVDVDVGALELAQDAVELVQGLRRSRVARGSVVGADPFAAPGSTPAAVSDRAGEPSGGELRGDDVAGGTTSAGRTDELPSAARVIVQPAGAAR